MTSVPCDNDLVVRELDVYMTNMQDLHLLQFPLRPKHADIPPIDRARLKPRHKKLELSVPYDPEILGNDFESQPDGSQKFVSTTLQQTPTLVMGVVRDGSLHLTHVRDVLQIRPTFETIRRGEITEDMEEDEDDVKGEAGQDQKKTLQQVHIRRKETERTENSRLNSYTYVRAKEDAEPWIDMTVHMPESEESGLKLESLYFDTHAAAAED